MEMYLRKQEREREKAPQGHSFNQKSLSLPHGSKKPGKRLVLEILHGCYLKIISSASAQNSGSAISKLE